MPRLSKGVRSCAVAELLILSLILSYLALIALSPRLERWWYSGHPVPARYIPIKCNPENIEASGLPAHCQREPERHA